MARPNMKSVRLSDQALAIVNDAPGAGFNDKFERLIIEYSNSINSRKLILENLEKQIERQRNNLNDLKNESRKWEKIIDKMESINVIIKGISQDVSQ